MVSHRIQHRYLYYTLSNLFRPHKIFGGGAGYCPQVQYIYSIRLFVSEFCENRKTSKIIVSKKIIFKIYCLLYFEHIEIFLIFYLTIWYMFFVSNIIFRNNAMNTPVKHSLKLNKVSRSSGSSYKKANSFADKMMRVIYMFLHRR